MLVYTAIDDKKKAKKIAKKLLAKHLAACIQIQKIKSLYKWQGKLCNEKEFLLCIKTAPKKRKKLCKKLRQMHSYDTPEIACISVKHWDKKYKKWLDKAIRK